MDVGQRIHVDVEHERLLADAGVARTVLDALKLGTRP
jgi:hypothetical protein